MFAKERLEDIVKQVEQDHRVYVHDLANRYGVSEDSIRKDLTALEKEGKLKKVYGGAVSLRRNPHLYSSKDRKRSLASHKLAEKAMGLLTEGERIFLDISLSSEALAEEIVSSGLRLTVYTNMLKVAEILSEADRVDVTLFAGKLNRERDGVWSSSAVEQARRFRYDQAFFGAVGIDLETGAVSTYEEEDGLMKQAVLSQAGHAWLFAEEKKFSEEGDYIYADLTRFTGMITDGTSYEAKFAVLEQNGLEVIR